jgi:hypothetical protein
MNLQLILCNHVLHMWLDTYWDHSIYSPPVFSGVRVNRYEVVCVCFVDRCLSFCSLFLSVIVLSVLFYGFWLSLWYLQTLLDKNVEKKSWFDMKYIRKYLSAERLWIHYCPLASNRKKTIAMYILSRYLLFGIVLHSSPFPSS